MYSPDSIGPAPVGTSWDRTPVAHHGPDPRLWDAFVAPGRYVLRIPGQMWDFAPGECTAHTARWVGPHGHTVDTTQEMDARAVLVCCGCGLNCT